MIFEKALGFERGGEGGFKAVSQFDDLFTGFYCARTSEDKRAARRGDHADGVVENFAFGNTARRCEDI